jgi:hypothetical protein
LTRSAHPNERAITATLQGKETAEAFQFDSFILVGDSVAFRYSIKLVSDIGIAVLDVFSLVFLPRFQLLGVTADVDQLRQAEPWLQQNN